MMGEKAEMLLWQHIAKIEDEALKTAEETDKDPKAKVSIAFEWPVHNGEHRRVKAKLSYSIKHEDVIEEIFDPEQQKINFEEK